MDIVEKDRKLTCKTKEGCKRLIAVFLAIILLSSFLAHLLSTDGGTVKITRVKIDTRGAVMDADLYYPAGTDSHDKIPGVVVAHGGGVAKGVTQGLAEEFARRGYAVLNISAYGAGMSEQPNYDDFEQGVDMFVIWISACGMLDAVRYMRTVEFVDSTRIGIVGHSLGAMRASIAATADCGFLTLNDRLVNILADTFGEEFTEEEISKDALELAKSRLSDDQLQYFNKLAEECKAEYDTRIKSICLLGSDGSDQLNMGTATVAGYDVVRNVQTNAGIILGLWDHNIPAYEARDRSGDFWHTTPDVENHEWYVIDCVNKTGADAGQIFDTTIVNSPVLKAGMDNRSVRIVNLIRETHSKNFFSKQAAKYAVEFTSQALNYNRGDLTNPTTVPLASSNIVYIWREILTFIAMLGMVALLAPVTGLLIKSPFFASGIPEADTTERKFNKKKYWLFSLITVALVFFAMYRTNLLSPPELPAYRFLPLFPSWWLTVLYLAILAVVSIIFLIIYSVTDKKALGKSYLSSLNFKIKFKDILKAILASVIVIMAAYFTLVLVQYLFNEDFRIWMAVFTEMRTEYWRYLWRYALLMLPSFLIIGAATNYSVRTDIPEWKDTLITVIVNSLGVWLLCLINYLVCLGTNNLFSSFISSYGFLVIVPITVYITRKMYKLTNTIWYGALINSFLLAWNMISSCGLHCDIFYGQNWISNFFGM